MSMIGIAMVVSSIALYLISISTMMPSIGRENMAKKYDDVFGKGYIVPEVDIYRGQQFKADQGLEQDCDILIVAVEEQPAPLPKMVVYRTTWHGGHVLTETMGKVQGFIRWTKPREKSGFGK